MAMGDARESPAAPARRRVEQPYGPARLHGVVQRVTEPGAHERLGDLRVAVVAASIELAGHPVHAAAQRRRSRRSRPRARRRRVGGAAAHVRDGAVLAHESLLRAHGLAAALTRADVAAELAVAHVREGRALAPGPGGPGWRRSARLRAHVRSAALSSAAVTAGSSTSSTVICCSPGPS